MGRHSLPPEVTSPVNTGLISATPTAVPVGFRRLTVTALTAGALMAGLATAHATTPKEQAKPKLEAPAPVDEPQITAALLPDEVPAETITAEAVELVQEEVAVETEPAPAAKPAPVIPKPAPLVQASKAVGIPTPAPAPVAQAPAPVVPSAAPAGRAEVIVNAALAQVNQMQDCTRLVTRALAAAGINFHGWPVEYYSLGYAVSAAEALPGDLIYYANGGGGMAHIAVYTGNGQAVHGGYNGNQTVHWKADVPAPATAAQYIRLR